MIYDLIDGEFHVGAWMSRDSQQSGAIKTV